MVFWSVSARRATRATSRPAQGSVGLAPTSTEPGSSRARTSRQSAWKKTRVDEPAGTRANGAGRAARDRMPSPAYGSFRGGRRDDGGPVRGLAAGYDARASTWAATGNG